MTVTAKEFLTQHNMLPESIDPLALSDAFKAEMLKGLESFGTTLPMIPTYLSNDGNVPKNRAVAVIDAGGTNFRCGLLTFTEDGCKLDNVKKSLMPGIKQPATWDEFISFVADNIEPIMPYTDKIGFCFSYSADITPEIDGKVIRIDKEVVIKGCEGQLVGESLCAELAKRGYPGKRCVIINDTAAVLIGGSAVIDKNKYSDFIGQVSGTGTNTCCIVPGGMVGKIGGCDGNILINIEAGLFDKFELGTFDKELDKASTNCGIKYFEKVTAGVYLGELVRLMLRNAAQNGIVSPYTAENILNLGKIDSAVIDAWAAGENLEEFCDNDIDRVFISNLSLAMFERSARFMTCNLLGIMKTIAAPGNEKPICVLAEGSLVQKGRFYRGMLRGFLKEYALLKCGYNFELVIGNESTLPGAGAAALLNI